MQGGRRQTTKHMSTTTTPRQAPLGGRPVPTATSLEADAAEKLVEIIAKYEAAGLLGETWTFRVGRSNGGRIRVFHDGECPLGN